MHEESFDKPLIRSWELDPMRLKYLLKTLILGNFGWKQRCSQETKLRLEYWAREGTRRRHQHESVLKTSLLFCECDKKKCVFFSASIDLYIDLTQDIIFSCLFSFPMLFVCLMICRTLAVCSTCILCVWARPITHWERPNKKPRPNVSFAPNTRRRLWVFYWHFDYRSCDKWRECIRMSVHWYICFNALLSHGKNGIIILYTEHLGWIFTL